jgi:hypothetical protein
VEAEATSSYCRPGKAGQWTATQLVIQNKDLVSCFHPDRRANLEMISAAAPVASYRQQIHPAFAR